MERSPNFSLYPAGIHLPFDTSEAVFSSISGWAAATSSYKRLVYPRAYLLVEKKGTYDGELVKRPGTLDVLQSLLQVR